MAKTVKQFREENLGKSFGYPLVCNRVFTFKPWFGEHEGQTVMVAAMYSGRGEWDALYAELKETGEEFEMVCTFGTSKEDLADMIMGC